MTNKLNLGVEVTRSQQNLLETWSRKISQAEWTPGEFIGSDLALSEQFGVSRTVVRGALDILQQARIVRRIPRRGIVLEQGFTLNRTESAEVGELMFIRWIDDALAFDIVTGLLAQAKRMNFSVKQGLAHQTEAGMIELLDSLPENCRNVAMMPLETPGVIAATRRALERGTRIVQLDRYIEDLPVSSVVFDNYRGGALATRHLLARGTGPVYYFGCFNPVSCRKRFQGWEDSMRDAGFLNLAQYVIPCPDDSRVEVMAPEEFFRACRERLRDFLRLATYPLSIFAVNDAWARQIYEVAPELGKSIGYDIRVVGFDNLELCERLSPTLTSIAVPRQELGVEAVKLLADTNGKMVNYCKILPVELKIRQSS